MGVVHEVDAVGLVIAGAQRDDFELLLFGLAFRFIIPVHATGVEVPVDAVGLHLGAIGKAPIRLQHDGLLSSLFNDLCYLDKQTALAGRSHA